MDHLASLSRALTVQHLGWPRVIEAVRVFLDSINKLKDPIQIQALPCTKLMRFVGIVSDRVQGRTDETQTDLIEIFANPDLSSELVLGLLDGGKKAALPEKFRKEFESRLLERLQAQHFELAEKLLAFGDDDRAKWAAKIVGIAEKNSQNSFIVDLVGEKLLTQCRSVAEDELIGLLPAIRRYLLLKKDWSAEPGLFDILSRGYFIILVQAGQKRDAQDKRFQAIINPALLEAVFRYQDHKSAGFREQLHHRNESLERSKLEVNSLKKRISEQEAVMRELRSGMGGDTQMARFDERRKVMRDLAATVAEFERMFTRQERVPPEINAIMRRLNNILVNQQIIQFGVIGETIPFDPSQAKILDGEPAQPEDSVQIVERGYKISRSPRGRTLA